MKLGKEFAEARRVNFYSTKNVTDIRVSEDRKTMWLTLPDCSYVKLEGVDGAFLTQVEAAENTKNMPEVFDGLDFASVCKKVVR